MTDKSRPSFSLSFLLKWDPDEDDFLTYRCFPGCGCDHIPSNYAEVIRRYSFFPVEE